MEGTGHAGREPGLEAAIRACGGISELARRLGISQPSVSHWQRVPAERVLMVEQASGVSRSLLRPDLYPVDSTGVDGERPDEIDAMRAQHWGLLARLLARAPEGALLRQLASLEGDETPLGAARAALAEAAAAADARAVEREFHDLFIGLGRGELLPYASYYLTGFLHERPLAKLRAEMDRLGIARAEDVAEPEDHVATVSEIMAGLLRGAFGDGPGGEEARRFFARHIAPWAQKFFSDLEAAEHARFYRAVGRLGSAFVAIEAEAATLPA
jgi:TorA maturation chaperone TorD